MKLFNETFSPTDKIEPKIYGGKEYLTLPEYFTKPKRLFVEYLEGRGFDNIDSLVSIYDIHQCLVDDWKWRLIFPVYFKEKLVTWVGRSIGISPYLPYMDLSIEESVIHSKYCLYNYDNLKGGEALFVTEGIFDALKIDYYSPKDVNATCLFTKTMRKEQEYLLYGLSNYYDSIYILLDSDAKIEALKIVKDLSYIHNVKLSLLPDGVKDPGCFNKYEVNRFVREFL